ncbi:hypothetical protein HZB02_01330 [Candidatus Woesearchaeota archaeon]|nr:hypothetical protein [Candidatus Woesearchaeota archaeon]
MTDPFLIYPNQPVAGLICKGYGSAAEIHEDTAITALPFMEDYLFFNKPYAQGQDPAFVVSGWNNGKQGQALEARMSLIFEEGGLVTATSAVRYHA